MRVRTILAAAALAVSAASLVGPAAAMAASDPGNGTTICANATADSDAGLSYSMPQTITSNLTVPSGAICRLYGNTVQGNVTVNPGAVLHTFGATFAKNVTVNGGQFLNSNWGVTIGSNLQITDPIAGSQNGFGTGNNGSVSNEIKGSLIYTIDSTTAYPMYNSPQLYFGSPTKVDKGMSYSDQGTGFPGHLDGLGSLTGSMSITGNSTITQ
jgi:hypothetical protein